MLFHKFTSQDERRECNGSDFIEIQYCRLKRDSKIKKIISIDAIENWKDDSLYISGDDIEIFFSQYNVIFDNGIYNNEESGVVDMFGINYYSPEQSNIIVKKLLKQQPLDYKILLIWLKEVEKYNGFYILGE